MSIRTEAEANFAAIIASSNDAIIGEDLGGDITSWNPAAERIFGYREAEMIGEHISLIIPPERLREEELIVSKIKNGEYINQFESVRNTKGGQLINLSITASAIRNSDGEIIGASTIARDIVEASRPATHESETAKRKDEFIGNLSHELRTPLNAIIGLATLLELSAFLPEKEKKYIRTLKSSADSLLELVSDLVCKIDVALVQPVSPKKASKSSREATFALNSVAVPVQHWNILLVDDNEPNILVAGAMVEQLGYDYDVANNGLEALAKFHSNTYDLILMDIQMQELDGLETSRRMRELEKDRNDTPTPIVAITANVCEQDRKDCLDAGMDDFVPKPFHPSELASKLAYYIPKEKQRAAG